MRSLGIGPAERLLNGTTADPQALEGEFGIWVVWREDSAAALGWIIHWKALYRPFEDRVALSAYFRARVATAPTKLQQPEG